VNNILNEDERRIVLAHELGHAILHCNKDIYFIREYTLFPVGSLEAEANRFAAELLIDCVDLDIYMFKEWNIEQISRYLKVSEDMAEYKLKSEHRGDHFERTHKKI